MECDTRVTALENEIRRLDIKLKVLEKKHKNWSWWRLIVFISGVLLTYLVANFVGAFWGVMILVGFLVTFSLVIARHRSLARWMDTFRIWKEMRHLQISKIKLNWNSIPNPSQPDLEPKSTTLAFDLDLVGDRSIHKLIDRNISREGSQLLADWLTQVSPDIDEILVRQQLIKELRQMTRFRDRLYLNFKLVSDEPLKGSHLLKWLITDVPTNRLMILVWLSSFFCLVNVILFGLNLAGLIPAIWPVTFLLYLAFYFSNIGFLTPFLDSMAELDQELEKFRSLLNFLEFYPFQPGSQISHECLIFRNNIQPPSAMLRKIRLVTAAVGARMNPILGLLINLFSPWDFFFAFMAGKLKKQAGVTIPEWLETWTRLEVLVNLADYAFINPGFTFPKIIKDSSVALQAKDLGHPLISSEDRICNDFLISKTGSVILITGSNMSGKSTFIKTIGINLSLAYAGSPVNASSLQTLPFRLHTCIRINDSITDGYSYFYAEVKCLKCLLDEISTEDAPPLLYLIDEIFRGTNNRERYLGSLAFIRALAGKNGVGLIATHDLDLAKLSEQDQSITNYHFSDAIIDNRLSFDYKIMPGPSQTTNALRIMDLEGLPVNQTFRDPIP